MPLRQDDHRIVHGLGHHHSHQCPPPQEHSAHDHADDAREQDRQPAVAPVQEPEEEPIPSSPPAVPNRRARGSNPYPRYTDSSTAMNVVATTSSGSSVPIGLGYRGTSMVTPSCSSLSLIPRARCSISVASSMAASISGLTS